MKKQIKLTILFLAAILVSVSACSAANLTVGSGGTYSDIQSAYGAAADNGDTILIADGQYSGAGNTNIIIAKNITIQGQSQTGTIINGTNTNQIFQINSGVNVILMNLTLSNGYSDSNGGAIYNEGNLTVINCTFINSSSNGGYGGGAIYSHSQSILNINQCTFRNNGANLWGGAIFTWGSEAQINDCIFQKNHVNTLGGAIYNWGCKLTINNCTFTENKATTLGGAISNDHGTVTILESNFVQNIGSAIDSYYGTTVINYCRIINNEKAITSESDNLIDAQYNWFGSNNPDFSSLIVGASAPTKWLFMTINATPSTINNTETSLITVSFNNYSSDGINYTPFDPAIGHIPDGTLVTFNAERSIDGSSTTSGGVATATFTADGAPGEADVNAVTDSQTVNTSVMINSKSSLYLTITPSKTNPVAGDTVVYTLKVGNNGPDTAENVVMTYVVPEGLEFVTASDDTGNTWTYDENTRTITWNLGSVPKGDPNLWITLRVAQAGQYIINPTLTTSSFDPTLNSNIQSLTFIATADDDQPDTNDTDDKTTNNTVNAASKTVTMQETGLPLPLMVLAILMVLGGLIGTKRN